MIAIIIATFSGAAAFARLCSDSTVSLLDPVSLNVNLKLSKAKVLDVFFSAASIPLILAVFNFAAFQLIHTSALHEHEWNRQSVPVATVVELSTTSWGSYSPFKFWYLVSSKDVRCILAAITTTLVAFCYSCLTNIVGYQAVGYAESMHNKTLDYLYQPPMAYQNCNAESAWFDEGTALLCANVTGREYCPKHSLLPELPERDQVTFFKSGLTDITSNILNGTYPKTLRTGTGYIGINASLAFLTHGWPVEQPTTPHTWC